MYTPEHRLLQAIPRRRCHSILQYDGLRCGDKLRDYSGGENHLLCDGRCHQPSDRGATTASGALGGSNLPVTKGDSYDRRHVPPALLSPLRRGPVRWCIQKSPYSLLGANGHCLPPGGEMARRPWFAHNQLSFRKGLVMFEDIHHGKLPRQPIYA